MFTRVPLMLKLDDLCSCATNMATFCPEILFLVKTYFIEQFCPSGIVVNRFKQTFRL